ncbi:class I SAM-dependent methyltransferase [Humidisolicoccus flavus]|uniref:class I SAM-dependent methyltransferase n=1 Tax=Humidisolicoccus flavus TaxID=3111414 RepID=UPI00324ACB71
MNQEHEVPSGESVSPKEFWEQRYGTKPRMWSGHVNTALASVVADLVPGSALDIGCGEGGDVIWLAQHGWNAIGVDISETAIARASAAADAVGLSREQAGFVATDVTQAGRLDRAFGSEEQASAALHASGFDLVTSSFFQSPVELARTEILRAAAERVAPGGHLLLIAHASAPKPPAGSAHNASAEHDEAEHSHGARQSLFVTPSQELRALALDEAEWTVVIAELRPRIVTDQEGRAVSIDDSVVLLRRSGESPGARAAK